MHRELTRQDIEDILLGCTVLGTGGGGELSEGLAYIDYALDRGKSFKLISLEHVPESSLICTPYLLGALVEAEQVNEDFDIERQWPIFAAYERLVSYTGQDVYGTICCELGGANTAISFMLAAMVDGYIIDADPTGRAVPEITHSTYYLNDIPASPIISANARGEVYICENIHSDKRSENIMRALCSLSDDSISVIDHIVPLGEIKHAVIDGTISKAMRIGKYLRQKAHLGMSALTNLAKHELGQLIYLGTVQTYRFENVEGFTVGHVMLENDAGQVLEIQVKNENMACLLDNVLVATIPDLICCFNATTAMPITNPNFSEGMSVAVVLLPAPIAFLNERGLQIFGPRYAGFDVEFTSKVSDI